jgi:hypothetical protein
VVLPYWGDAASDFVAVEKKLTPKNPISHHGPFSERHIGCSI